MEQLRALSSAQLRERSGELLCPAAAKLPTHEQRNALEEYYTNNARQCLNKRAPEMARDAYDEILKLLRSLPWDAIARRTVSQTRKCAPKESFVLGGVLGHPGFRGFEKRVGKMGYNDKIVPAFLAKQAEDVMRLWGLLKPLVGGIDPQFEYTSVQVNRNFRGTPHRDKHDVTYQYALALGEFDGGRLVAETSDPMVVVAFETKGRPTKLDGRRVHWVEPYQGERFSLLMFA